MTGLELVDEEGVTHTFRVARIITQDKDDKNREAVFSNELMFRPGGGAIARRIDNRVLTLPDDAQADAWRRQPAEVDELRRRGSSEARTGGEHNVEHDDSPDAPRKMPRRGTRQTTEAQ